MRNALFIYRCLSGVFGQSLFSLVCFAMNRTDFPGRYLLMDYKYCSEVVGCEWAGLWCGILVLVANFL